MPARRGGTSRASTQPCSHALQVTVSRACRTCCHLPNSPISLSTASQSMLWDKAGCRHSRQR